MTAHASTKGPLATFEGLTLRLPPGADRPFAVSDVSFDVHAGEVVCLVGESGSGKSVCAQALMGLLPPSIVPTAGRILLDGADLLRLDSAGWRRVRGRRVAMVFQEPMTALNPVMRIGAQVAEMFEAHGLYTPRERRVRVLALLAEVGLPDPAAAARAYPHQLSGGQRQRATIAMALALEPALLVADEPTTALDVTTQAQVLRLLHDLQRRRGTGVLFITHDLGVVRQIADRVVVMRRGEVVEHGPAATVLDAPQHPYTRTLRDATPSLTPPGLASAGPGAAVLEVRGLSKTYRTAAGPFAPARIVHAVRDVGFALHRGETLGLVGESGSGKSTVLKLVSRLLEPDAGSVRLAGADLTGATGAELRALRRRIPVVFQDPFASLSPRRRVGAAITDGAVASGRLHRRDAPARARALLEEVGLDGDVARRFPHEFSGGQRQRIGIARALACEPEVLLADEPVSALDVSVQKQVIDLLRDLKLRLGLAMLFVTHDLHVAAQLCDRIAVMFRGEIVEVGPAAQVLAAPAHAYTQRLLAAVPGRQRPG